MHIKLITIKVKNLEESVLFYQDVLGFKEVRRIDHIENLTMIFLQDNEGGIIELIENKLESYDNDSMNNGRVTFALAVKNMDKTISQLACKHIVLSKGPIKTPDGDVIAFLEDPNGVEIELIEGFIL